MEGFKVIDKSVITSLLEISKDYQNYIADSVIRELSYDIANSLAEGKVHLIVPFKKFKRVITNNHYHNGEEELVVSALTKEFPIPDVHPLIAGALLDEMLKSTEFVRVNSASYVTHHIHPNRLPIRPANFSDAELGKMSTKQADVYMNPICNSQGRVIGTIGRCEECGRIFYSIIGKDEVI